MIIPLLLVILIAMLLLVVARKEGFGGRVAPWDVDDCKLMCFQAGQRWQPWVDGKVDGAWNDPAQQPDAIFDVAACMRRCD